MYWISTRVVTSSLTCLWAFSCASIGAHSPVHLWQRLTSSQIYKHILALKEFVCSGRRLSSLNFSSTVYCLPTSNQPSRRWVLWKWKYSKEHRQYHQQEMDLELLKGSWNNWGGSLLYIWTNCARSVKAIAALWWWDFAQRKAKYNKPKSLSCRKTVLD